MRILSLDLLKVLLSTFVIFTHSAFAKSINGSLVFPLLIDMAVPCFLTISSYFCTSSVENKKYDPVKKIVDIGVPFVFVCLIEAIIRVRNGDSFGTFRLNKVAPGYM